MKNPLFSSTIGFISVIKSVTRNNHQLFSGVIQHQSCDREG